MARTYTLASGVASGYQIWPPSGGVWTFQASSATNAGPEYSTDNPLDIRELDKDSRLEGDGSPGTFEPPETPQVVRVRKSTGELFDEDGDTLPVEKTADLDTADDHAVSRAALKIAAGVEPFELVPTRIDGDSYANGGYGSDNGTRFWERAFRRLGTRAPTNQGVAGTRSDEILARVRSTFTPPFRGLIGLGDVVLNDVRQNGGDTTTNKEAFRSILAHFTSKALPGSSSSALRYGPDWSAGASSTVGSYVDLAFSGDSVWLLCNAVTGSGGTLTVTPSGAASPTKTITTGGFVRAFTLATRLSGFGSGNHTVRITLTAGSVSGIAPCIPSEAPPTVLWTKTQPPIDAQLAAGTPAAIAACATVLADFPTVVAVDLADGWDEDTMIADDDIHLNDLGNRHCADKVIGAVLGYAYRQGLNSLTGATPTFTPSTPAYAAPGATAPSAPTSPTATADNQVIVTWTRAADGGATVTSQEIRASSNGGSSWTTVASGIDPQATSYTIQTGLTQGTSYIFQVRAVNSAGNGAYSASTSAATAGAEPATYAADPFTSAGALIGSSTPTGAYAWAGAAVATIAATGWATSGGQATGGVADVVVNDTHADGTVSAKFNQVTSSQGLIARRSGTDESALLVYVSSGSYKLARRSTSGGTYTTLATLAATPAAGDVIAIVLNGSSVKVKVNGSLQANVTETTVSVSNTRHGLWCNSSGGGVGLFDDFTHTSITT